MVVFGINSVTNVTYTENLDTSETAPCRIDFQAIAEYIVIFYNKLKVRGFLWGKNVLVFFTNATLWKEVVSYSK